MFGGHSPVSTVIIHKEACNQREGARIIRYASVRAHSAPSIKLPFIRKIKYSLTKHSWHGDCMRLKYNQLIIYFYEFLVFSLMILIPGINIAKIIAALLKTFRGIIRGLRVILCVVNRLQSFLSHLLRSRSQHCRVVRQMSTIFC